VATSSTKKGAKPADWKNRSGNRRGNPDGPPVRGRRGHKTVDQQKGFRAWLEKTLLENPGITYDQLVEELKGSGYYAARSTLAREGLDFEITRAETRILGRKARIIAGDDEDDGLTFERASSRLAVAELLDHQLNKTTPTEDEFRRYKAIAVLQSSAATALRAMVMKDGKVRAAVSLFVDFLTDQFKNDAHTLKKIHAGVKKAFAGYLEDGE
jgi:hypothetical protein